jgi:chromosome segregation ATPase
VVIQSFEETADRIEQAEVVQHVERLDATAQRYEDVQKQLADHAEKLPEILREAFEEHRAGLENTLSEKVGTLKEALREIRAILEDLEDSHEERLKAHHDEVSGTLSRLQEEWERTHTEHAEQLQAIETAVADIAEKIRDAELQTRLDAIQNAAASANQTAQNGLSRMDAMERSLSDTLEEHRRDRERQSEQFTRRIDALEDQLENLQGWVAWTFWSILGVAGVGGAGLLALTLL